MIKCEFELSGDTRVEVRGSVPIVMTEVEIILKEIREKLEQDFDKETANKWIEHSYKQSFMSEEEICMETDRLKNELIKNQIVEEFLFSVLKKEFEND